MPAKPRALPAQSYLRRILDYDPDTGALSWRPRSPEMFREATRRKQEGRCKSWNKRCAGRPAFTAKNTGGYFVGKIDDHHCSAHRIIYKWMTGKEPNYIDHINRHRADNRWVNLRSVTHQKNMQNRNPPADRPGRVTGVTFHKKSQKWVARIKADGKHISLGSYAKFHDAVAARKIAEIEYGFRTPFDAKAPNETLTN